MFSTTGVIALAIALQTPGPEQAPASPVDPAPITVAAPSPDPAPPLWTDNRPLTHFFQNLGHDLAALPSLTNGAILMIGAAGAGVAKPLDGSIHAWAARQPGSPVAKAGNHIGDGWSVTAAAVGIWAFGKASGHTKIAHVGGDLMRGLALDGLLVWPAKYLINRARPNGTSAYAFPSGHSAAVFTTAAVLHGHFGWKAGLPMYALGGLVGWSRIRSDSHWLTDVIVGATLGLVSGQTATADHRRSAWKVVPAGAPGGAAVLLVYAPSR